jgi:hypothetical protein
MVQRLHTYLGNGNIEQLLIERLDASSTSNINTQRLVDDLAVLGQCNMVVLTVLGNLCMT